MSLKPSGQRKRNGAEIREDLRKRLDAAIPELRGTIEIKGLIEDQINDLSGAATPIEVKIFGPDLNEIRKLATKVGTIVKQTEAKDVETHVDLENSDIIVRPDSVQVARVGLTSMDVEAQINAALYGQVASTLPEQDRITDIRVRYPDRVRYDQDRLERLPISLGTPAPGEGMAAGSAAPASRGHGVRPLRQVASINVAVQRQRTVAREPAADDQRHRRADQRQGPGQRGPQAADDAAGDDFPARLSLGTGRRLQVAAGVVRQPGIGDPRGLGAGLPPARVSSSAA